MTRTLLVMRYLAVRAQLAARYDATPLDALLASLDREPALRARADDVLAATDCGESWARRLHLGPDTCLFRALSRYVLLRRAGLSPRFVMGIDPNDVDVGHAWVELDGHPIREGALTRYVATYSHPSNATAQPPERV